MTNPGLSVSRLVNVTVTLSPALAQFPSFNTCLLLGTSDVIDVHERMREYNTIAEVAADFGTEAEEYLAAVLWFEQDPQPASLLIGRWANVASAGLLVGGGLSVANSAVAVWNAIDDGAFKMAIDGVGPTEVGNLDFSAAANMNAVAAIIESGFPGGTATVTWDATNRRFTITSTTTGVASTVSFATAPDAGTDISVLMGAASTSSGVYAADGVDAQTAAETVVLFENQFGSDFYGLVIPSADNEGHLAVAAVVEASNPPRYYGVTTQEAGVLVADDDNNIAALLKALDYGHTAVSYSSTNPYAVMSYLARILTVDWGANNTALTLMYKQEPGIVAETLTASQMNALLDKNCNVFVAYDNDTAIIQPGMSSSGDFTDTVIGTDWLRAQIQTNLFNLLYGTSTKIPQTDAGMGTLATGIEAACITGVRNGLIAPGIWNSGGFGQIKQGDYLPAGYYVYTPPISSQSQSDREARASVAFQVAVKLGGAVHSADVAVNVNP